MIRRRTRCLCKVALAITCFGFLVLIRRQPRYTLSFNRGVHRIYKPNWDDRIALQNATLLHNMSRNVLSGNFNEKNATDRQVFIQFERHRILTEACKKNPELSRGNLSVDTQRHILVNTKQKLLYCFVPKVGCSNWKRVMMKLARKTSKALSQISSNEAHGKNGLPTLLSFKKNERRTILATYTSFMYARNPFARIVSAYKNKFGDVDTYRTEKLIHDTARMMIKKYRENPSQRALETGENVTWNEFVSFLTDPVKHYFNEHWREMFKLCSPCKVRYDFLGHLETLNDDALFMFQELDLDGKIHYPSPKTSHPTNSTNTYQRFYTQLPAEQIHSLWKTYQKDFELFGYPKPSFVPSK